MNENWTFKKKFDKNLKKNRCLKSVAGEQTT